VHRAQARGRRRRPAARRRRRAPGTTRVARDVRAHVAVGAWVEALGRERLEVPDVERLHGVEPTFGYSRCRNGST
jgi:hypothetical protein